MTSRLLLVLLDMFVTRRVLTVPWEDSVEASTDAESMPSPPARPHVTYHVTYVSHDVIKAWRDGCTRRKTSDVTHRCTRGGLVT